MSACSTQWQLALFLLREVISIRLATTVSFGSAASACEKAGRWQEAHWVLEFLEPCGRFHKMFTFCHDQAFQVLQELWEQELAEDVVMYGTLVSACEKSGQWTQALVLLDLLRKRMLQEDVVLFNALISACEKRLVWCWKWLIMLYYGMLFSGRYCWGLMISIKSASALNIKAHESQRSTKL